MAGQYPQPGALPAAQGAMMPPPGPYGYQPAAYYDPAQGAVPTAAQPLAGDADGRRSGYMPGEYVDGRRAVPVLWRLWLRSLHGWQ